MNIDTKLEYMIWIWIRDSYQGYRYIVQIPHDISHIKCHTKSQFEDTSRVEIARGMK